MAFVGIVRVFSHSEAIIVGSLARHVIHLRIHVIGSLDDFGVRLISTLCKNHLHKLGHHINIRIFQITLLQVPKPSVPPGLPNTGSPELRWPAADLIPCFRGRPDSGT